MGSQAVPGSQALAGSQAMPKGSVGMQYAPPRGYLAGNGVPVAQQSGYPQPSRMASRGATATLAGAVTLAVLLCAAEIALWLGVARACRRGSRGARVAGTVLFALHTVGMLGVVASSQAGLGPAKALTLIGWLIGLGAVVALWQRPSSAFFAARAPLNR